MLNKEPEAQEVFKLIASGEWQMIDFMLWLEGTNGSLLKEGFIMCYNHNKVNQDCIMEMFNRLDGVSI